MTVFGAGLLVGTALAVIIPEGINAMYTSGGQLKKFHDMSISKLSMKGHEIISDK